MNNKEVQKWNKAAAVFDMGARSDHMRYGSYKQSLFGKATGRTLLVATGTGQDFRYFDDNIDLTAIDFSPNMLEHARKKANDHAAAIKLVQADVTQLGFPDQSFDTIVTSCTFCSVPDPATGFAELHRVLKDDGKLLMFEHVRSQTFLLGTMMDIMNPISKMLGPNINRRTGDTVRKAGFHVTREYNIYLDMAKLFEAVKAT